MSVTLNYRHASALCSHRTTGDDVDARSDAQAGPSIITYPSSDTCVHFILYSVSLALCYNVVGLSNQDSNAFQEPRC
jgi:hypothetical protein